MRRAGAALRAGGQLPRRAASARPRRDRRQARRLHPRARQGRPQSVRHRHRHRRRPGLRRRRHRDSLHHPVGIEALHVRPCVAATRPRGGAEACRRRAHGRSVQCHRARRGHEPAVQPHGQCRRHRRGGADGRSHAGGARRQHAGAVLRPRRAQARDRRVGLRVGAGHRPSQPGDRLHDAQYRHDQARSERGARSLFPSMFGQRHGARSRHHGRHAGQ